MRYTQYRGLTQVTKWVKLKFAAMNLKKMAMGKWDNGKGGKNSFYFWLILRTSAEKFTIKIGKDRLKALVSTLRSKSFCVLVCFYLILLGIIDSKNARTTLGSKSVPALSFISLMASIGVFCQ